MPARHLHSSPDLPDAGPQRPAQRLVQLAQAASLCGRDLRRALQERTRELELSDADLLVLWSCARADEGGVAQNALAEEIGLSAAQASGLLDRLRRSGLVCSRRPARDRRRQLWRLEPAGRQALDRAFEEIGGLAETVMGELSDANQSLLESLLSAVSRAARETSKAQGASETESKSGKEAA